MMRCEYCGEVLEIPYAGYLFGHKCPNIKYSTSGSTSNPELLEGRE